MSQMSQKLWYWRVAILRCLLLMALTGGSTFLGLTESIASWSDTKPFSKFRIFIACAVSGGTVLIAFLDTTIQALRARQQEKSDTTHTGHTEFITKE